MDKAMHGKLAVIVGGYLGDEGKGKATQTYLQRYSKSMDDREIVCIRSSGGTNTGATVYYSSSVSKTTGQAETLKLSIHMLPVGAFRDGCHAFLGNGVYFNIEVFLHEMGKRREMLGENPPGKVYISKYAHFVTDDCLKRDAEKEAEQELGSTKNGVSIAASDKYSYRGVTVEEMLAKSPDYRDRLDEYDVYIVDPYDFFEHTAKDWNMVLEGTQGVGLDINHGFKYPYVSAGSFSTYGLLDGVGYALAPTDVCMVLKTYGSYFGKLRERGDFEDNEFREFANEFGTTTGRPRNLSWIDAEQVKRAASLVRPTEIMLNCMDRLNWFPTHGKKWSIILDDDNRIDFEDPALWHGGLTRDGRLFVETIEEYANAHVKFLGVGPKHDDIIER